MKDAKVVIRKVKKAADEGHHGGSWKVAYADFVTAMMAFFLLLWLLTMVSEEKRIRLAAYFKYFSLFEEAGRSFMSQSSEVFNEGGESYDKVFSPHHYQFGGTSGATRDTFEEAIKRAVETMLGDVKDQILVKVVDDGVKIEIVDKDGSYIFPRGSTELTPKAKKILRVLGDKIGEIDNRIIIEGHTDSYSFSSRSNYTNWELSADRANATRRYLESIGIDPSRITRVVGYADRDLLIKDDPWDPRNRRIDLVILFEKDDGEERKRIYTRPGAG